jgi:predicted ATP-grasp superfamily ATP-dependent carboligase
MNGKKQQIPVILFGDHIAAYGAIKGLAIHKIPIYIVSKTGAGLATKSKYVKKSFAINPQSPDFVAKLNNIAVNNIGEEAVLMVAGEDDYLDMLSQQKKYLLPGFKYTFPDWDIVELIRKKRNTYKIADQLGIPVPKTYYITNEVELREVLDSNNICFPIIMKSEESGLMKQKFRIKGVIANNNQDIIQNYTKFNNFFGNLLLQEMIPGGEENLYCLKTVVNRENKPLNVFVDKKLRSAKQFLACTLTSSTWSNEVVKYGLQLLEVIRYLGYASVEFKFDVRDQRFKLMEINGRISMNNSHALRCGINLPFLMYKDIIDPLPFIENYEQSYADNILWWYPCGDIASLVNLIKNKQFNLHEYFSELIGKGYIVEPFLFSDLYPFLFSFKDIFVRPKRKLEKRGDKLE